MSFDQIVTDRRFGYPEEHLSGKHRIARDRERHLDFVPDESETLRVIEDGSFENGAVGNAHNASVVQIFTDPTTRFHYGGAKKPDIDHVASGLADLDSVSHGVQF